MCNRPNLSSRARSGRVTPRKLRQEEMTDTEFLMYLNGMSEPEQVQRKRA